MHGGGVHQCMHGVQPQAVGVEVAHPSQRAVDDIVANLVGVGAGDIDAVPHGLLADDRYGPNRGR